MTADQPALDLPERFDSVEALDEFMSRPTSELVRDMAAIDGDIVVIGVGGKMGPTVARMAKRSAPGKRVIGVARFSEPGLKDYLETHGVETVVADLLDAEAIARLPEAQNVIFMAGRKFGSSGQEDLTWAMNAHVPALIAERYRKSRIVAYSTICVYPFVPVTHGGATEDLPPNPPGEYAQSCVGRERMFQHFSLRHGTPGCLIRLSYAIDMRYGVLHDIARKIWAGEPVDVTMGHVNVIWQGDAAAQSLRALCHCAVPSCPLNVSGPETASVRALAKAMAAALGRDVRITGEEAPSAWLANTSRASALFGYPKVPLMTLVRWVAEWVRDDMPSLGKPTHFEVRSGDY
jgi:nucleoside-diphosphate-sugar epimerase